METIYKQYRKEALATLKAEIKASAARAKELRVEARKLSGMERWHTQREAEDENQRYRFLAYGFLRNKTYKQIENKARTLPRPYDIARYLPAFEDEDTQGQIGQWVNAGDLKPKIIRDAATAAHRFQEVA